MHPAVRGLTLAVVTCASTAGYAQSAAETEATWRTLVGEAQAAESRGDHAQALYLAGRALQTHATPSLHLFVAEAQQSLGRLAPALASAQRCVDGATADPNIPERAATLATCTTMARALDRQVGRLVIVAPTDAPAGLQVFVGDAVVPAALLGVPYVVTPGSVVVRATAPDRQPFRRELTVTRGASVPVDLALAPLATAPPRATPHPPPTHAAPPGLPADARPSGGGNGIAAIATAAGAGVALVLGVVGLAVGSGAASDFNSNPACTQFGGTTYGGDTCQSDASRSSAMRGLAIGGLVAAGVLGGTSTVLWVMGRSSATRPAATALGCGVGPGTMGVACALAF